jgi:hypothetical protein
MKAARVPSSPALPGIFTKISKTVISALFMSTLHHLFCQILFGRKERHAYFREPTLFMIPPDASESRTINWSMAVYAHIFLPSDALQAFDEHIGRFLGNNIIG